MALIDLRNLPKDCGCATHEGPHWLHMDKMQFELNLNILKRRGTLRMNAFAVEEAARLREKVVSLKAAGVGEADTFILPDGYMEHDYSQIALAYLEEEKREHETVP